MLSPFGADSRRDAVQKMPMGSGKELAGSPGKRWPCFQACPQRAAAECGPVGKDVLARMIAERMPWLGARAEMNDCRVAARLQKLFLLVGAALPVREHVERKLLVPDRR